MYAAILLCSAMLAADTDTVTVRMVNTLEQPVQMKFRIVGKPDWLKDELSLDAAQTKNFALPKADKYEVVIRDANKKDVPVGSWDLGKMLAKDAKAEIHIMAPKANNSSAHASGNGLETREEAYTVEVPLTVTEVFGGKTVARTVMVAETRTRTVTVAAEGKDDPAGATIKLAVFSNKQYFAIAGFIDGKRQASAESKPAPAVYQPGPPVPAPAPAVDPLEIAIPN